MKGSKKIIETPVAIFAYNRPDHTGRLINILAEFKFKNLIFITDGPKNEFDDINCLSVLNLIKRDWGCQVDYVVSDINLGCKNRVVTGLNYVFQKFESAIILEDDCLPAESFFEFCESILKRYSDDSRILMACGTVLVEPEEYSPSYFFSQIPHIWGWATWRNRWQKYSKDVDNYNQFYDLNRISGVYPEPFAWSLCEKLQNIASGDLDTWDAQMTYLAVSQNLLSVFPKKNLIKNIGFDGFATHTKDPSVLGDLSLGSFDSNTKHPEIVMPLRRLDLDRMLLEGHAGRKWKRLIKVLSRKNGFFQIASKLNKKMFNT